MFIFTCQHMQFLNIFKWQCCTLHIHFFTFMENDFGLLMFERNKNCSFVVIDIDDVVFHGTT